MTDISERFLFSREYLSENQLLGEKYMTGKNTFTQCELFLAASD